MEISAPSETHEGDEIFKVGRLHCVQLRCANTLFSAYLGAAAMEAPLQHTNTPTHVSHLQWDSLRVKAAA